MQEPLHEVPAVVEPSPERAAAIKASPAFAANAKIILDISEAVASSDLTAGQIEQFREENDVRGAAAALGFEEEELLQLWERYSENHGLLTAHFGTAYHSLLAKDFEPAKTLDDPPQDPKEDGAGIARTTPCEEACDADYKRDKLLSRLKKSADYQQCVDSVESWPDLIALPLCFLAAIDAHTRRMALHRLDRDECYAACASEERPWRENGLVPPNPHSP